jgi:hypothetical protein
VSEGIEVYPDDSLNAQAILLAVETGVPPQDWLELGIVGMNTAMMYVRNKMKREAAYFGQKIRDGGPARDDDGRQMSG